MSFYCGAFNNEMANEARRVELARTNLISNKREWNNCFTKTTPKI